MSNEVTFEKIKEIILTQLDHADESKIVPGANFTEDLGADSLDVVELVMKFEEYFDLEIDDSIAAKIETVEDAYNYIKSQKSS
jgi:acyl carrier protein